MTSTTPFVILRVQKLKSLESVRRSLKHGFREQNTPNADPDKLRNNSATQGLRSSGDVIAEIAKLLPEKRRKDAVLTLEYLVTGSPEAINGMSRDGQDAYFRDALEWLKQRHGAENVVFSGVHRDESTPHMYAYVVPIDSSTGRLNARKWLGGAKALNQMQSEFASMVGSTFGLVRGIEGSKAKHQTVKRFYAAIENKTPRTKPSKTLFGNIRPEEHIEVENALAVFQQREIAIKKRESKLKDFSRRLEEAEEKARESESYTRSIERQFDQMTVRYHKAMEENEALENIRRELISERDHYRNLLAEKSGNDLDFKA